MPEPSVAKLVEKLSQQRGIVIDYRIIDGANHFFHERMDLLNGHVDNYLDAALEEPEAAEAAASGKGGR